MIPYRLMAIVFLAAALAYVAVGRAVFTVPASLADAEACGFTSADFSSAGRIDYPANEAWWLSFVRKQEYWSALTAGMAFAFVAFALWAMRRVGAGIASGAAVGGGLLAFGAVCIGCLAPALSVVGISVGAAALAGIPKWMLALNTLLFTGWGTLFLSRRLAACPVTTPACAVSASSNNDQTRGNP